MKRICIIFFAIIIAVCSVTVLADNAESSIIDANNSTFENITDVSSTAWFKLVDASGDSKNNSAIHQDIRIKTDGGHSGKNYLQISADKSWISPSINCYPFFKDAGEGTYIVSFYYRCSDSSYTPKKMILFRGLVSDIMEDSDFNPYIKDVGSGNQYATINGTYSTPDENGWSCFVSEPFDVVEAEFDGDHNWWFCLDGLPNAQFTYDIDDFVIVTEDEFEDPNYVPEVKVETPLTYLTGDAKSSVIPKVDVKKSKEDAEKVAAEEKPVDLDVKETVTVEPEVIVEKGLSLSTAIILAIAALVVFGGCAYLIIVFTSKKEKK